MTDVLHLGCGDHHMENAINVDYRRTPAVDEIVDLNDYPWPWVENSMRYIIMEHLLEHLDSVEQALRECARILKPNGRLRVVWPMGMNECADPDHKHSWIWDTPEMYCGKRDWDVDVGLEVAHRNVVLHSHFSPPVNALHQGLLRTVEAIEGQGRWMFDMPVTSGEFTVVFKKP
ncbi:MAG: methyltransferase domain-containing protein [Halobacteriaceae archaeon]